MASNKSVVVLTPNGRRQTVKVTPNTTILHVNDFDKLSFIKKLVNFTESIHT